MTSIASPSTTLASGTYTVDPSHSRIGFTARHAMVTKVRGSFNEFTATAIVNAGNLAETSVQVTIDAASIDTRNEQRDAHVRGADFFDVETYPSISFASTEVTELAGGDLRVVGDLTIKDQTRPVTIDFSFEGTAQDPFGNNRAGFEGSVVVNRKDWGLTWNAALEAGGVLVSDKVTLEFELSTVHSA